MIVYRYLRKSELLKIIRGELSDLGSKYKKNDINTFRYNPNERYLHFFKKLSDIEHIRNLNKANFKGREEKLESVYFCSFKIPNSVLMFSAGFGFYDNSGYDVYYSKVIEFAIKCKKFKASWLHGYLKDNPKEEFDCFAVQKKLVLGHKDNLGLADKSDACKITC